MKPEDIENREFLVSLRGYARDEVDSFKADVARAMRQLLARARELAATLDDARAESTAAKSELDSVRRQLEEAKQGPVAEPAQGPAPVVARPIPGPPTDPRSDAFHQVALETEKILMAAEEVAEELHEKAMREAAGIVTDARLRAEKIFAEVENAKRGAQQELERIRESRSMIASQMEDIGRRLAETVARLRVPVESPQRQAVRARLQAEGQRAPERPDDERQSIERQAGERQAAMERQSAGERQSAERQMVERQAAERQAAVERQAAAELQRRAAERRAMPEPPAEPPTEPAPPKKAAEQEAAVPAPAPEVKAKAKAPETKAPDPAPARTEPGVPSPGATEAQAAAEMVAEGAPVEPATLPAEADEPAGEGSSLSQLLDEIRRTRQTKPSEPAKTSAKPAPAAATAAPAAAPAPAAASTPAPAPAAVAVAERSKPVAAPEPVPADPMLELRTAALGDLPVQASRRLKRLLQEDHNDLLDRLRTRRGKGALDDNLVPMPEQFSRFQGGLSEALSKAFAEGRKAAGGPGTADPVKAVSNLVARQVVNPLRAEISKAVQKGLEAQDTPTAIAERASDVFRVWKGVRTEMLGEGIVYAAFNQGLVDGFSKNKKRKQWVLSEEVECPSDVCARNVAAGPVALQSTFPSGHLTPPAHGGCACTLKSV